ncbi:Aste57867_5948 [Aphanomyces stellatus]|uniref:Aste57867_5948 protein n=1 Tax=Aphanomyces stellatus TaxID=120398 RepID=A0A485KGZ9_9STRA|nr:hypothetical protein As57867_005934 [Aphanomyces stellatus]VFT82965.1 Aste57867_5948 [Aphanomyces stellatus]
MFKSILVVVIAAAAALAELQTCDKVLNLDTYFSPLVNEPSLVPCMKASGMASPDFLMSGRMPSRQQLANFFASPECRVFFEVVRQNYATKVPNCAVDSLGTPMKQLASLDFDQMGAVYTQALQLPRQAGTQ